MADDLRNSRYVDMTIYDIIKPQHSSTDLLYVAAIGYVLSELGRISRSLKRQKEGEHFGGNIKSEVNGIDCHIFSPLAIYFFFKTLGLTTYHLHVAS
jgi:hypothetical protein